MIMLYIVIIDNDVMRQLSLVHVRGLALFMKMSMTNNGTSYTKQLCHHNKYLPRAHAQGVKQSVLSVCHLSSQKSPDLEF